MKLCVISALGVLLLFSSTGLAGIKVKCGDCTHENPCSTVFTFKDLKFHHSIYCRVDADGKEHWDSTDYEKLQTYDAFPVPPREKSDKPKVDI